MQKTILFFLLILAGCAALGRNYHPVPAGELPRNRPDWNISESPYFSRLQQTYGQGAAYEQAKIKYLLGHIATSSYLFDRNGIVYNSSQTVRHLTRKYNRRRGEVQTARDFINKIASFSAASNRPYLVLPGDGKAYRAGDILHYELDRLEAYMDSFVQSRREIA